MAKYTLFISFHEYRITVLLYIAKLDFLHECLCFVEASKCRQKVYPLQVYHSFSSSNDNRCHITQNGITFVLFLLYISFRPSIYKHPSTPTILLFLKLPNLIGGPIGRKNIISFRVVYKSFAIIYGKIQFTDYFFAIFHLLISIECKSSNTLPTYTLFECHIY